MNQFSIVQFAPNVPQQISLGDVQGQPLTGQFTGQVYFPLSDGRALVIDSQTAGKIERLQLQPNEAFSICKQWDGDSRHPAEFSVWLSPQSEKQRAAVEREQSGGDLEEQLRLSIELMKANRIPKRPPTIERAQPIASPPLGTGTNGPVPMPAPSSLPRKRFPEGGKIPYNVAFREILHFVTAELKATGEQWNDQAKQDLISTCFISATKAGMLAVWEREGGK